MFGSKYRFNSETNFDGESISSVGSIFRKVGKGDFITFHNDFQRFIRTSRDKENLIVRNHKVSGTVQRSGINSLIDGNYVSSKISIKESVLRNFNAKTILKTYRAGKKLTKSNRSTKRINSGTVVGSRNSLSKRAISLLINTVSSITNAKAISSSRSEAIALVRT